MDLNTKKKATAMAFDPSKDNAPTVIAKGEGHLAFEMLEIARAHQVKIIQDPELSQLASSLPIHSEIPENLYTIMAQIFGMVMRMRKEESLSSV